VVGTTPVCRCEDRFVDAAPGTPAPCAQPLAQVSSWTYDPAATMRVRGIPTATLLVYPRLVRVVPVNLPRSLTVPEVDYEWPSVVVQRFVWSYRLNLPGIPTVLLDINGQLGSAMALVRSARLSQVLCDAGCHVIKDTVRGWETPRPLRRRDHPDQQGRLPGTVLVERSWWARDTWFCAQALTA
jgi:hypothetical protein